MKTTGGSRNRSKNIRCLRKTTGKVQKQTQRSKIQKHELEKIKLNMFKNKPEVVFSSVVQNEQMDRQRTMLREKWKKLLNAAVNLGIRNSCGREQTGMLK